MVCSDLIKLIFLRDSSLGDVVAELSAIRVTLYGLVQGVFFRDSTRRQAQELNITGYVRNLRNVEAVEVHAEGEKVKLEKLVSYLKVGPPRARVDRIEINWSEYSGNYPDFSIRY
jgi:acylphosphatase